MLILLYERAIPCNFSKVPFVGWNSKYLVGAYYSGHARETNVHEVTEDDYNHGAMMMR